MSTKPPATRRAIALGPKVWVPALVILVALFAGGLWLRMLTGWPDRYGWHCQGRCYFQELWHSPVLLGRDIAADLLFANLWFPPVLLVVGSAAMPFLNRRMKR